MIFQKCLTLFWKCAAILVFIALIVCELRQRERTFDPPVLPKDPRVSLKRTLDLRLHNTIEEMDYNVTAAELENFPIRDYFRMLKTATGVCRKLVRVGGEMQCRTKDGKSPILDGDKTICIDPEMEIVASRKTEDCTVLSFGISTDTSFDEGMRVANCQVHMFDVINFDPMLNDSFMTFHKIGLGSENVFAYFAPNNVTVQFNTLDYIIERFNLSTSLINILKIDIEEAEWHVFNYLTEDNFLSAVGQIAVEVHVFHALNNTEQAAKKIRKITQILLDLENKGFRRVTYSDNVRSSTIKDEEGMDHKIAGELLLVNSKWY